MEEGGGGRWGVIVGKPESIYGLFFLSTFHYGYCSNHMH